MSASKQIGRFAALMFVAAFARDVSAEEAATGSPPVQQERHAGEGIEEIIVTSEMREQSVQDVPVSVTAITSEQRVNMGITTIADLANFTPGFTYGPGDRPSIRGIGRMSNNLSIDNAIATYADGAWTNSVAEAGKDPIFVERSEILRGPQGTLYGRNAIGGAINVISKRPTNYFEAEARATGYNYGGTTLQGSVSGPITDSLRYRAAYSQPKNDGYYKNLADGSDDMSSLDLWYAEGQLEWDITNDLQLWVVYRTTEWNDDALSVGYNAAPYNAATQFGIGSIAPSAAFGFGQPIRTQLGTVTTQPGFADEWDRNVDFQQKRTLDDVDIGGLHLDWNRDSFGVHYVFGGQQYVYQQLTDFDGTPITSYQNPVGSFFETAATVFPTYRDNYIEDKKWYSHELTFTSAGEGALHWVGGLYYFHDEWFQSYSIDLPDQPQVKTPTNNFFCTSGPTCGAAFGFPYNLAPTLAAPNPTGSVYYISEDADNDSYAAYAQVDYDLTEQWQLTLGARYTDDKKTVYEATRLICFGVVNFGCTPLNNIPIAGYVSQANDVTTVFAPGSGPGQPGVKQFPVTDPATGLRSRKLGDRWDQWTGTAGVQFRPNADTLTYLRYSRGYKAGGLNAGSLATDPLADEETVDAFELGWKQTFGDSFQLYSSAFYYQWHDMQVPLTVVGVGALRTDLINVPDVDIYGAEFEMQWQPIDNLFLMGSYAYLNTEIQEGCCYVNPVDPAALLPTAQRSAFDPVSQTWTQSLDGNPVPQSPENRVTVNASYNFNFSAGTLILSTTYVWRDEAYNDIFNTVPSRTPDWDQVDLRVVWRDINDRYTLIGFVRNAGDTRVYTTAVASRTLLAGAPTVANPYGVGLPSRIDQTFGLGAPQTYGVELQYKFTKK